MELDKLRKEIDKVDTELIQILNKRVGLALRTKGLKTEVEDPLREKEVLNRIRKKSPGLIRQELSERIYKEILKESKNLQNQDLRLIGFQGEHGAYSEVAARGFDPSAFPIPHAEFGNIFEGVETGQIDLGIVPIENSLAGSISEVADRLIQTDLKIVAEKKLPIKHCLMTLPETGYRNVKSVYSHMQALAQCRGFLKRNNLDQKPYYDTAGAAMMLARERPAATGVIASSLCAELYDLDIIKENIQDLDNNYTRFLILSRKDAGDEGDKCSIAFSTKHKAGALFDVMKSVAEAGINMTKIESRPILDDPGNYAFLMDFQGSARESGVKNMLKQIKGQTTMFRYLGCYKEDKD